MNKDPKISSIQIRALIVSTTIGVAVLSLPNNLSNILGKDGWIPIIIAGALMIPLLLIINQIFKQNPGKDYFEIGKENLGSIIFTLCFLIFLAYLVVYVSFVVRNLGELVKAFLLPTTPIEVIILIFILSIVYISSYEIDVIARYGYFVYPIIIGFVLLFLLVSLPTADFSNTLPSLQSDLTKIPIGIKEAFLSFAGFEIILFALPYVEDKEKALKSSIIAIITITLIYFSLFMMTLTQFSIEQIKSQAFPVLIVAKLVDLPGYFLQNLDNIFMSIWVIVVFATVAPAYFGAGKVLSKIFKTKSHRYFIWVLVPIIYKVSLMPEGFVELNEILGTYLEILGFISILVIPLIIFIVGSVRRRIGK